jgi:CBS domain-containing protein
MPSREAMTLPPPVTGATPLFALQAVALDLETTGLDVDTARIVQIGAIWLTDGHLVPEAVMDRIVNPVIEVPAASTAIHGITGAMAAEAPELSMTWPEILSFMKNRVVIGHTIAYDLTVLEREAARHQLAWQQPRSLCVRRLARLAIPSLHDPSLDKIAAWLKIDLDRRHHALGDAEAAGEIFLRFVPLLAARGIRTLAEAERAILALASPATPDADPNWVQAIAMPNSDAVLADTRGYDTFAYRHEVGDLMTRDLVVINGETALLGAMRKMAERGASSVLVADPPDQRQPLARYAILTERDALRQIAGQGDAALQAKIGGMAMAPLISIREGAYVYRAIARMRRLKVRHLVVVDDVGDVVGMISARDLLKSRSEPAIALSDAIKESASASGMAIAWAGLAGVVRSLTHEGLDAHTTTRIVSEELRSMTERAAELAVAAMAADGKGEPPSPFAVMVLGSGGRGESLLKPDQDNAIVYAEGAPDCAADQWFAELGARMATILDQAGIPYCTGGVMAKNPEWRGSLATWKQRIEHWVASADPKSLLNVDIFFDQVAVMGQRKLAQELFVHAYAIGSRNPAFAKLLGSKLDQIANPFGFLGRLNVEGGKLDLKLHALFPIVSAARTLAIRHNIPSLATRDRLRRLAELGRGDATLIRALTEDHGFCLSLMLREQARALLGGEPLSNMVGVNQLIRREGLKLREALKRIQLIPELVRDLMF